MRLVEHVIEILSIVSINVKNPNVESKCSCVHAHVGRNKALRAHAMHDVRATEAQLAPP